MKGKKYCVNRITKKVHQIGCKHLPKKENKMDIDGQYANFQSAADAAKNLLKVEQVEKCGHCS